MPRRDRSAGTLPEAIVIATSAIALWCDGFSVHAGVVVPDHDREALERLCGWPRRLDLDALAELVAIALVVAVVAKLEPPHARHRRAELDPSKMANSALPSASSPRVAGDRLGTIRRAMRQFLAHAGRVPVDAPPKA